MNWSLMLKKDFIAFSNSTKDNPFISSFLKYIIDFKMITFQLI